MNLDQASGINTLLEIFKSIAISNAEAAIIVIVILSIIGAVARTLVMAKS